MALSDKQSRQALIPSFLYRSSSSIALEKMLYARPNGGFMPNATVEGVSARKGLVIPSPSEPLGKIEMYSPSFYAACTFGGILSCGLTHMAVVNPENTFFSVKRFIGRTMSEVDEESWQVSYKVVRDANGNVKVDFPAIGKRSAVEEISAQGCTHNPQIQISNTPLSWIPLPISTSAL